MADITYGNTDEGWLYVAGVLNRCTRRRIGWAMGGTLATTRPYNFHFSIASTAAC